MINSFLVDISREGIKGSGGLFGTFAPQIGDVQTLSSSGDPSISVRRIQMSQTVSALTNPKFLMPIAFGSDKVLIWINQKLYIPMEDYRVSGTEVTWLNTDKSITPSDDVVLWGPANKRSADFVTFERINLRDPFVYNDPSISLKAGVDDNELYPYNQDSTYLFLNGDCLKTVTDYTYNSVSKTFELEEGVNSLSDRMFAFYYNLKPSTGFRFGEALVRLKKSDGVANIALSNPTNNDLREESHVFLNGGRAVYAKNYAIRFPLFKWDNFQNLQYDPGDVLDISYFSDMRFSIDLFSDSYTFAPNTLLLHTAISKRVGFHYVNGVLSRPPVSDSDTTVADKDYDIVGQNLVWSGTPPVDTDYSSVYEGFTDLYSNQYIVIRTDEDTTQDIQLPDIADTSKIIAWKEGIANFSQHLDFTVNEAASPKTLTFDQQDEDDKLVLMYFRQTSYADMWKFEPHVNPDALPANSSIALTQPAKRLSTCWVFVNGVKLRPEVEFVLEDQNRKVKFLDSVPKDSKVTFVYI